VTVAKDYDPALRKFEAFAHFQIKSAIIDSQRVVITSGMSGAQGNVTIIFPPDPNLIDKAPDLETREGHARFPIRPLCLNICGN
jgi:hypothetical protein